MKVIKTDIPDLLIIEPKVFEDSRGYFYECYNEKIFNDLGIKMKFVQDNQSKSSYGVIRGLHYQLAPYTQTKLVRVLQGAIYDVVVDIRKNSPAFGHVFGVELSCQNKKQLLVPKGFAHGFSVLSESAVVMYKCDSFYNPEAERGFNVLDAELKIDWKIESGKEILAARDKSYPSLREAEMNFIYGKI